MFSKYLVLLSGLWCVSGISAMNVNTKDQNASNSQTILAQFKQPNDPIKQFEPGLETNPVGNDMVFIDPSIIWGPKEAFMIPKSVLEKYLRESLQNQR
jgi:hypothetical protein